MEVHRVVGPGFPRPAHCQCPQVLSYLKATDLEVELLFNFGESSLIWERLIKSRGFRRFRGFVEHK